MKKVIENTNGKYSITSEGKVFSHVNTWGIVDPTKWIERKQQISIWGYPVVDIVYNNRRKKFLIHRLVGTYFLDNPEDKPCINHIDGNKLNNCVSNLEWVTYAENEQHSHKVLGKKPHNCKPIRVHTKTGEFVGIFDSMNEACRYTGAQQANALKNIKKLRTHAAGYVFTYEEDYGL